MADDTPSQATETFEQTWARLGGTFGADAEDATEAEPDKPAEQEKPEKQAPPPDPPKLEPEKTEEPEEPEPKDDEPDAAAKRQEVDASGAPPDLAELAKKHGFKIEGKTVAPRDWAKLNNAKRKQAAVLKAEQAKFAQEKAQHLAELEKQRTADAEERARAKRVLGLLAEHDFEALATEGGLKDFNEIQEIMGQKLADPNYLRTKAAKEAAEAAERRAQEVADKVESEAKQRQQAAEERAAQAKISAYKTELAAQMAQSENPYLQAFNEDPWVLHAIYAIQRDNFDSETGMTVTPEEALDEKVPGTDKTVRESVDFVVNRIHKHIAKLRPEQREKAEKAVEKAAEELREREEEPENKPVSKTSPTKSPEGAAKKKQSEMTPREQSLYFISEIDRATR